MMMHTFVLTTDYIELNKLLKFYSLVESGAQAKQVITEGWVTVNGHQELRIRNKLVAGDKVQYNNQEIVIE
jgi:ribosome-associated protein